MTRPTSRYIASLLLAAPLLFCPPAAGAGRLRLQRAAILDSQTVDVAATTKLLMTFDVLVAGAEQAAQNDAAASRQLAHNGLHVAERPQGLSASEARTLWHSVARLRPCDKREALALLQRSDVVTTEAHALLLEMLGPAPDFAPHAAPNGLSPRQLAWVHTAPQLSRLMRRAWRDAELAALFAGLGPTLAALQPSERELAADTALLDRAMGRKALPQERVEVIVVPLMAKDTGATLMLGQHGAITLVGPVASKAERDVLVVHEMLHPRLAALIQDNAVLRGAIDAAGCLRQAVRSAQGGERAISQVYDAWNDYLAESWVRGLSRRLTHAPACDDGFMLADALGALGGERQGASPLAVRATTTLHNLVRRMCAQP